MFVEIIAKSITFAWIWCMLRLVIFNTFEIAYMLPIIIILDRFATPSSTITSVENNRSKSVGFATQEGPDDKKKRNAFIKGKAETLLNEMISKLMHDEKKKAFQKIRNHFQYSIKNEEKKRAEKYEALKKSKFII
ncbi:hypothetical protein NPIL_683651 [Nephila pilipes]|uniref:Uncharacterized protein n=1 Tax=Nephila pilipes TaxID=299642 RepID=A0A8X6Q5P8_NEPPI|nr:hypothetical protein NPIL_683651 [Nephila pilipes]